MDAGTDAKRRPVFHPRSSNRTCLFQASGFPTGFIVGSRVDLIRYAMRLARRPTALRLPIQLGRENRYQAFPPITSPFLLSKLTRSKGPSLHRHYPASSVPLTLSDSQMVRNPFRFPFAGRDPRDHPGPPLLTADYLLDMLCSLPRWTNPYHGYGCSAFPRRAFSGFCSAFPASAPGRRPHWVFRGLLELYSRYGLPSRSPTFPWTLSRGSDPASLPAKPLASYRI